MKKILYTVSLGMFCLSTNAQSLGTDDALRYSLNDMQGTARFRAMSGAFGALGGDFSAINVNPAGAAVFANNQIGVSLSSYNTKNNSNYFGTSSSQNDNSFDLNQAGGVFVFNNVRKKSDWKKFTLAVDYENTQNFNNSTHAKGANANNSIDDYFLSYANGIPLSAIDGSTYNYDALYFDEQQAYLGYQSYIIDPATTTTNNNTYYTNVSSTGNYYQENRKTTSGYNGKLAFNFATQYTDKWYFGLNLNSHFSDYSQSSAFFESNTNAKYPTGSTVNNVRFYNDLHTYGKGFSFQLGTIFKPTNDVRLGFSYESPTWYKMYDELAQSISTSGYGLNTTQDNTQYNSVSVNPNTTMVYEPYRLQTPQKFTGSFAYVFDKKGLISIDYAMKDYSSIEFRPTNSFDNENNVINNTLTSTSEVRIGGEYKIKKLSLRGGYRWEQSPYKDGKTVGDLTGYSTGLGYNFGGTKLDFSYSFSQRDYVQKFLNVGMTDAAKITNKNNNFTLSLLFEL